MKALSYNKIISSPTKRYNPKSTPHPLSPTEWWRWISHSRHHPKLHGCHCTLEASCRMFRESRRFESGSVGGCISFLFFDSFPLFNLWPILDSNFGCCTSSRTQSNCLDSIIIPHSILGAMGERVSQSHVHPFLGISTCFIFINTSFLIPEPPPFRRGATTN